MRKPFRDTEAWKYIRTALQIAGIVLMVLAIIAVVNWFGSAIAEQETESRWVVCMPGDGVNVRPLPNKHADPTSILEPGREIQITGKPRNGYVHCVGLASETCEGWVSEKYLVNSPVVFTDKDAVVISKGRLAVRKCIGGKRTRWLKPGDVVRVYLWSAEWCVTDVGYVQTRFLELGE